MSHLCKRNRVQAGVILHEYTRTHAKGENAAKSYQKEANGFPGSDMNEQKL